MGTDDGAPKAHRNELALNRRGDGSAFQQVPGFFVAVIF